MWIRINLSLTVIVMITLSSCKNKVGFGDPEVIDSREEERAFGPFLDDLRKSVVIDQNIRINIQSSNLATNKLSLSIRGKIYEDNFETLNSIIKNKLFESDLNQLNILYHINVRNTSSVKLKSISYLNHSRRDQISEHLNWESKKLLDRQNMNNK